MFRQFAVALLAALLVMQPLLGVHSLRAGDKPEIVSRKSWQAKPANTTLMRKQVPREIVLHMTAVRQQPGISLERKLRGLQGFSMRPGRVASRQKPAWGDVPYHFYVAESGRIGEGRDLAYAGDTNTPYDPADRIHVVLEGEFDTEQPTAGQISALTALIEWLSASYGIGPEKISAHKDHVATTCPGKNLFDLLPQLRKAVTE